MPKVYEKDALKLGSYYLLRICYILILFFVSLKMKVTWGGFKFCFFLTHPLTSPHAGQYWIITLCISDPQKEAFITGKELQGSPC